MHSRSVQPRTGASARKSSFIDLGQYGGLWQEMIKKGISPTPIAFSCMAEALVANGATLDAKKLANQMWEEEQQRPLVSTVIYSTILKGFAK